MNYEVELTRAAARQLRKLPRAPREKVIDALEMLATDPRPNGARKLVGESTAWRIRVGDYRIIYDLFDGLLLVSVVRVGHRREVYR